MRAGLNYVAVDPNKDAEARTISVSLFCGSAATAAVSGNLRIFFSTRAVSLLLDNTYVKHGSEKE